MIPCDICGSDKPRFILASPALDGPLVRCSSCGLHYVGERRESLTFGSEPSEHVAERLHQANRSFRHLRLEEERRLAILNARWRLELIRQFQSSGRMVEVGCARGDFLAVARENFDVLGVEPNPELASIAQTVAPVYAGLIETLPDTGFDVAASFHVIEHADSPRRFIEGMADRVKPGGLVVIETPNIDSALFRIMKSKWRQFIPEHYFFFTPESLSRLLQDQGLRLETLSTVGKYASVDLLLNRLSRYTRLARPAESIARLTGLSRLTMRISPGDILFAVARK